MERVNAQPATPPSSPSLSAVGACEGRLLFVKPTLGDLEHDIKLVEAQLLGLDAMELRSLGVATAVDISASYEDACSETSFELDNEPSLETRDKEWPGKIARRCSSWPHPQLAILPDGPGSSPPSHQAISRRESITISIHSYCCLININIALGSNKAILYTII
ncbi:hypothetical protein OIDMADRAFT_34568 [Oidiodendron maius Zn]|uniref:Uncharacterized protein n=1 Tax=Oidiodendron maius (strain Zn) TaxID=913774 RepID=A0A0C3C6M5_OIDMZ|nr:hypothetical protein OIDMADRAFT_34568 [Oidiodendron maius Zn]